MKFKYTALGANNQKLEGVLEAETIDAAREQLHLLNFSVIAINELTPEEEASMSAANVATKTKEGIKTYYFLALDSQKKEVNGTIDSTDPSSAFRRLYTEYQFDVQDLYPDGSPDPAGESLKPQFEEWKRIMEDEGIDFTKKASGSVKNELEEGEKVSEEIVAEMDAFIVNTKSILQGFSSQYSEPLLREIERVLGELERIRASNNLQHITKLCNELFELISNPDVTGVPDGDGEKYEEAVSKLKGSGFVANRLQLLMAHKLQNQLARFGKIQAIFSKVTGFLTHKKGNETNNRFEQKLKSRRARWLSNLTRGLKGGSQIGAPTLSSIVGKFFSFVQAPSPILRKARKQELIKAYNEWKKRRKDRSTKKTPTESQSSEVVEKAPAKPKKDFSPFFAELDSFVGWLLFFYITYFYLVSFSIEKNVGLPKPLVLKTLSSPLILNISVFLIVAHLAFTLKIRLFRSNFLGSLFLFFLCFGLYAIIIVNF